MNYKAICLVITLLFGLSAPLNLQPDVNNPFAVPTPLLVAATNQIVIRFSFPSPTLNQVGPNANGSNGLNYKQFIGVSFPPSVGTDMALDQGATPKWTCALNDGTNDYTITAIQPVASPIVTTLTAETNTAYCRLDDLTANVPLKTGPGVVYRLTLTFTSWKITTNFLRSVSLFTSTSNNPEKMIIDSMPVLGTLASYGDYTAFSPKALDISSAAVTVTQGPSSTNAGTTVYAYNTFDITLALKTNSFISAADHLIVFKYPTDAVTAATSVASADNLTTDPLQLAIKGTLTLATFGTDGLLLSGVTEDLIPNRQFKLSLKGWKSIDTNMSTALPITVVVYYKNTYSVLSYVQNSIFNVAKTDITLTSNHPEFWEVYSPGAWPIAFTFKANNNDLTNGGWFVIQQTNTVELGAGVGNKVSFIASTCDFSANDSTFDNSYGKRVNCYPLRNDMNYPSLTAGYNGSGIFFWMKGPVTSNKVYKLTVWAFFDDCGGSSLPADLNVLGTTSFAIPAFTMTVFKFLNPSVTNESRFSVMQTGVTRQSIIASSSSSTAYSGKCWNAVIADMAAAIGYQRAAILNTITIDNDALIAELMYKEFFDWHIFQATADFPVSPSFVSDLSAAVLDISTSKFFFSTTSGNLVGTGSYFLAALRLPAEVASSKLAYKIPLPIIPDGSPTKIAPGKVVYQFPGLWFVAGQPYKGTSPTPICYASWGVATTLNSSVGAGTIVAAKQLIPDSATSKPKYTTGKKNFFGYGLANDGTTAKNYVDTTNSLLPPDYVSTAPAATNIMRLVSSMTDGDSTGSTAAPEFLFMDGYDSAIVTATEEVNVGFFTTCVKWVTTVPTITSLYTYIDIQIKYNFIKKSGTTTGMGVTISNFRLIKLFPEAGVFNDWAKFPATPATTNPVTNHVAFMSSTTDAICLLELSTELQNQKDSGSNTLAVWLFFGTLLETDYSDQTATYPAAPLLAGVTPYGLSSAQPMDWSNLYFVGLTNFTPVMKLFKEVNTTQSFSAIGDKPFRNNVSSYQFFMGSLVLFTSVTTANLTGTTEAPLLIPYYCPRFNSILNPQQASPTSANFIKKGAPFPTVFAAWLTSSAFNTITSINKYISYKDNNTATSVYSVLANRFATGAFYDVTKIYGATDPTTFVQYATLKFSPYTTTADNNLYVYNGIQASANSNIACTGLSLFLNNSVIFDTTKTLAVTGSGFAGTLAKLDGTKVFYAYGKSFIKAVYYGLGSATPVTDNIVGLTSNGDTASALYYVGIKRPTVDTFSVGGNLNLTDRIAFSCVSTAKDKLLALTNYMVNTTAPNNLKNFVLDWYRSFVSPASQWLTASMAYDNTNVAKNDIAGNFKVVLSPPVSLPAGSALRFTASSGVISNTNTICGLVLTTGGIVRQCDAPSAGSVNCPVPNAGTSFTVCCYNVGITTDTISLATAIGSFPVDSTITGLSTYLTSDIYTAAANIALTPNPYLITTNNASATDIIGTLNASISSIVYSQVNQEGGIGKVTFSVSLPREPPRDMKLSIVGDLTGMLIAGNVPRCLATFNSNTFGSTWDNGDSLIDSCSTNAMNLTTAPVVILTKKMVYKCGTSFSKTLFVNLWPVNIINWTTSTVKSFKVTMQLSAGGDIAFNTKNFDMTLATPVAAKPAASAQWDTLCTVSLVTPRIPGEVGDYQFDFDLDTAKASLANANPNEVTIFWPYQYFGSFIPNVMCFNNNISVNCSFTDEGILNVRFTSNLQVGSGKKISVIVIGVTNPAIDTDYSFPCTVNNSNFSTGVRTNLIVGSGKLAGGITTTGFTANGSLRFLTAPTPVSDKNPRNTSTHRFRVTFDTAVGLTTLPVTIAGTPVLYVYLPVNYRLALYSSKPTVTIEENTNDANNVTTKTNTYTPASIIASGNRIYIELTQASVTFGTNFRFWDIVISNVVNPSETTVQAGPPATQTSRAYFVTLTNKSLTALYRTYSNVNTYVSDALTTPVDSWLGWNRGNSFVFDNSKYIVDIYAVATQLNVVTIKPGRYLQTYFNMKPNSNTLLAPAVTTLTLTDNVFKLLNNSYTLPSSSNGPLGFMIGCACGTAPGSYVINFTSSETTLFGALSPVLVTVNSSTKATISTSVPANVPAGGSAFVGILLSDPNFDLFTVSWVNGDNANNDTSAKLTDAKVAPGTNTPAAGSTTPSPAFSTFTITNQSTTLPAQVFKTSDPNTCYTFGTTNTVSINISGTLGKVATDLNLSSNFKYFNSLTDPKLDKNAIRFQFTAPTVPVYIFCALSCINMAYPQDADILVPKLAPTNLIQFYSNYITTLTPLDIVFTNLVRGQQYHLRCLVQSAQGDPTLRTTASISFENFAVTGGNSTTINISPQASQPTQCAQFQFLADPGTASKNLLVNYCQTVFSAPGSDANGCPICTTSDMSYFPAGLSFPQNITCTATTKSRLRFLQASTASPAAPSNTTSTDVPTTLTVCPVPSPICKTDIAAGGKSYNDYLNAFTGALKTVALFKTNLNVDIKLNSTTPFIIINDATVPDITKVTGVIGTPATTGALSFTLNGISPVVCYWQLTDSTTAPVFTALSGCTDPSWCGKVRVGAATTTVNMGTPLKPFSATSTYNIYIGCTNDIPMSQQFSAVKSIGTAALPQSSNSTVAPPTPSNSTSPSTPGSSSFINTSLFALLLILSLIFN